MVVLAPKSTWSCATQVSCMGVLAGSIGKVQDVEVFGCLLDGCFLPLFIILVLVSFFVRF